MERVRAGKILDRVPLCQRFVRATLVRERLTEEVDGFQVRTRLERSSGQELGDGRRADGPCVPCRADQLDRMSPVARLGPPQRHPHVHLWGELGRRFDRVCERAPDLVEATERYRCSNHFTEERMRQPHIACLAVGGDETTALELGHRTLLGQGTDARLIERSRDGENLERASFVVVDPAHAHGDHVLESLPRCKGTVPAPDALFGAQRPGLDPVAHQLAEEQHVPASRIPHELEQTSVDSIIEGGGHELVDLGSGQRLQRDQWSRSVLPQADDGIGHGLAVANSDNCRHRARRHEKMDECGGCFIEKLRIVHAENECVVSVRRVEGGDHCPQGRVSSAAERCARDQVGHRAQWNRGRGLGRCDPLRPRTGGRNVLKDLAGQSRLADTRGACEHDASAPGDGRTCQRQFFVAPYERPLVHRPLPLGKGYRPIARRLGVATEHGPLSGPVREAAGVRSQAEALGG